MARPVKTNRAAPDKKKQKQHSLLRVNVTLEHYRLGTYTHAHINGICTLKSASGISMRKGEIAGGRGG